MRSQQLVKQACVLSQRCDQLLDKPICFGVVSQLLALRGQSIALVGAPVAIAAEKSRVFTANSRETGKLNWNATHPRAVLPVDTVVSALHRTLRSEVAGVHAVLF